MSKRYPNSAPRGQERNELTKYNRLHYLTEVIGYDKETSVGLIRDS